MSRPPWLDDADERVARAAWSRLAEPGDHDAGRFVRRFGAVAALRQVYDRGPVGVEVSERVSQGEAVAARWRVRAGDLDPRRDLLHLDRFGGRVVVPGDPEWPTGLDDLQHRAPFCLWVRGPRSVAPVMESSVSVVGARAATWYGERVAGDIGVGCAAAGITVVSGAAYGIDAAAHPATLQADGVTVAVLACGVDRGYPRGNDRLIEAVADSGCLVSEVPPGSAPSRWRFLERNRLIAAMTRGTVVVEAAWRSGAQGTAHQALELGRAVGAVPGPVTSALSAGCHRLLRDGATCVTDAAEVVELVSPVGFLDLGPPGTMRVAAVGEHDGLAPLELRVLDAVPLRSAAGAAAIARTAGLPLEQVQAGLGRLEARGLAEVVGRGWRRVR